MNKLLVYTVFLCFSCSLVAMDSSSASDEAQITFNFGAPGDLSVRNDKKMILSIYENQTSDSKDNIITYQSDYEYGFINLRYNSYGSLIDGATAYALKADIRKDNNAQLFLQKLQEFKDIDASFVKLKMSVQGKDTSKKDFLPQNSTAIIYKDSIFDLLSNRPQSNCLPNSTTKEISSDDKKSNFFWIKIAIPIGLLVAMSVWYLKYKK